MAGAPKSHTGTGSDTEGSGFDPRRFWPKFGQILAPERSFYLLAAVYGIGISVLSLAFPISVQMLINTVANIRLATPLIVLSAAMFVLLLASGLLNALRIHLMDIFGRRFYARLVSEISLRSLYAKNPFFADAGRVDLFNRYFDIVTIQKTIPNLLVGGFTVVLQAAVGFIVVSLYHPVFLVFNMVVVVIAWSIWAIWGRQAIRTGVALSHAKYDTARWLEDLAGANGFFKSNRHIAYALEETDLHTGQYIEAHKRHFRETQAQTIAYLLLYASGSAALLGLGGWLVIQGQLSLGQLVAAELILSAVFLSFAQISTYLKGFYDLCAAIDELSLFLDIDQEEPSGALPPPGGSADLRFDRVGGDARGKPALLNFEVPGGTHVMAVASTHGVQRLFTNLLKRHISPVGGMIAFGGGDLLDTEVHALRRQIISLDRPTIVQMTIREYLRLACEDADPEQSLEAIRAAGLGPIVAQLPDGLDTHLASTGWPLSVAETMQLKLAGALLARPRLLILNQLYDTVPETALRGALDFLSRRAQTTVMYFSNRSRNPCFSSFLFLDHERQLFVRDFEGLQAIARGEDSDRSIDAPAPRLPRLAVASLPQDEGIS